MGAPWYADYYVHTHLSPCGKPQASVEAMVRRAREKGLAVIGFADQITPDPILHCPFYRGQRPHLLTCARQELAQLAIDGGLETLVGLEDAHRPGDFDWLDLALQWAREMGVRDCHLLTAQELRERQRNKLENQGTSD